MKDVFLPLPVLIRISDSCAKIRHHLGVCIWLGTNAEDASKLNVWWHLAYRITATGELNGCYNA